MDCDGRWLESEVIGMGVYLEDGERMEVYGKMKKGVVVEDRELYG